MAFDKLEYSKNWENAEDFPTFEQDEAQVRKDMQLLHNETKEYLNEKLLPQMEEELNKKADDNNVLHKDETEAYTPTQDNHPATKKYVDDTATRMAAGTLPDQSVTPIKMADSFWDVVYKKEQVYSKDETYSKEECLSDATREAFEVAEDATPDEVLSLLADPYKKTGLIEYDNRLYRPVPDYNNPKLLSFDWSGNTGVPVVSKNYIGLIADGSQKFYSRNTGELVCELACDFQDDYYAGPRAGAELDADLFITGYRGSYAYTWILDPTTGKYLQTASVFQDDGETSYYTEKQFAGIKDGILYFVYQSDYSGGWAPYCVDRATLTAVTPAVSSIATGAVASGGAATGFTWRNCHGYDIRCTAAGVMTLVDVDLVSGSINQTTLTTLDMSVFTNFGGSNIIWVDDTAQEIAFALERYKYNSTTGTYTSTSDLYIVNYGTKVLVSRVSLDDVTPLHYENNGATYGTLWLSWNTYVGHLDDDTVLVLGYGPTLDDLSSMTALVKLNPKTGDWSYVKESGCSRQSNYRSSYDNVVGYSRIDHEGTLVPLSGGVVLDCATGLSRSVKTLSGTSVSVYPYRYGYMIGYTSDPYAYYKFVESHDLTDKLFVYNLKYLALEG